MLFGMQGSNLKKKATGSYFSGQWASTLSHPTRNQQPFFSSFDFSISHRFAFTQILCLLPFRHGTENRAGNESSIFHPRFTLLCPFYVPVTIFSNFLLLQTWKYDRFKSTNSNFKRSYALYYQFSFFLFYLELYSDYYTKKLYLFYVTNLNWIRLKRHTLRSQVSFWRFFRRDKKCSPKSNFLFRKK